MGITDDRKPGQTKPVNPWAPVQYVSNTQTPRLPRNVERAEGGNILLTSVNKMIDWGRSNSLWPATFGLVEMVIFIVTVFVAYTYVWRRGGLDWD